MAAVMEKDLTGIVNRWLGAFEAAVGSADTLAGLFEADSHWRDLLAFTWDIRTVSGAATIAAALPRYAKDAAASGFEVDPARTPPREVVRSGRKVIEAIFRFDCAAGSGNGVLRLPCDGGNGAAPKAWVLATALDGMRGFEETVGDARPTGSWYARDFSGPNWLDRRREAIAYADRDPAVLVVGGGQAGLSIAARLGQLGVDTLIVDREARVGDNWRKRYHALTLHNQVYVNHLPYMQFPPNWPTYIPKDKIAGWFEAYADLMELNFWTGTEFMGGTYDAEAGCWEAELRLADGTTRKMQPRHIVMAASVSAVPNRPEIDGLDNFVGPVLHSSQYEEASDWAGKSVLVIGTGTSGHDMAQDLHSHGASVTMVQRSPTLVVGVEPSAQLPYTLYGEGPPLDDCDLITVGIPYGPLKKFHQIITAQGRDHDRDLLDGLSRAGFRLDFGEDDTGWQFKYLTRGGGYYFNVGCSDLIVDGRIGLVQFSDIETFVADGARLRDGTTLAADLILLATGYKGQEVIVRTLFGDDVADRVGPVWGFDPDTQELRNMWMRTAQPGLWFLAGSFAQCRIYSRYLAMQIKACEERIIPLERPAE